MTARRAGMTLTGWCAQVAKENVPEAPPNPQKLKDHTQVEFMEQIELASADQYRGLGDTSEYTDSDSVVQEPVTDE